jgi:hypothetical protein
MTYYHIIQPDGSVSLGQNSNNDDTTLEKISNGNVTIIKTQSGLVMKLKPYVKIPLDMDMDLYSDSDDDY